MAPSDLPEVDEATARTLHRYGFDEETFGSLRSLLSAGGAGEAQNRIRGAISPPCPGDVCDLPAPGTDARARLSRLGEAAIRRGEVGLVVLAGGMATRFGGVIKAGVTAVDGKSFLDLKVDDARKRASEAGGPLPLFLMTSFATDHAVTALAARASAPPCTITTFPQLVSLRLTPEGDLFRDAEGRPSPYAPGHGDLTFALRRSGLLERFRAEGGRLLLMSNVDNATATADPAILGAHLESGAAITAEVVDKEPGDKGGAPARVDGRAQIVESFRFPEEFDQDQIGVFNTNTFVLDAAQIDRDFPLTWFAVTKIVDGRPAIQFEHLVGELTAFLPSHFLRVSRSGPDARFQPAKDPEELARRGPALREALRARGVL